MCCIAHLFVLKQGMKFPEVYELAKNRAPISQESWAEFEVDFEIAQFKKSSLLLHPDEQADDIFCIVEGVTRNFFTSSDGREYTKIFRGPGGLVAPYMEILLGAKIRYSIQAVTNVKAVKFSYAKFAAMMDKFHMWERLGRVLAEENYLEKERREYMLMHMNISEKYDEFLKEFGDFKDSIPQYQVASYLGVAAESLNRHLKSR
jgi:CRP-like cAMP-binding protein